MIYITTFNLNGSNGNVNGTCVFFITSIDLIGEIMEVSTGMLILA